MTTLHSHSEAETKKIAKNIASNLRGGDVVALTGELGAGKTAFAKGIAEALGVEKEIVSPTFAIMNVYQITALVPSSGRGDNKKQHSSRAQAEGITNITELVHIDTYRLKSVDELYAIGADEYIGAPDTITIIEWPEIAEPLFVHKQKIISVAFLHGKTPNERIITIRNKFS